MFLLISLAVILISLFFFLVRVCPGFVGLVIFGRTGGRIFVCSGKDGSAGDTTFIFTGVNLGGVLKMIGSVLYSIARISSSVGAASRMNIEIRQREHKRDIF